MADTVVRRGETPLPVRTPLPVQLPEPMAEQLRVAAAQQAPAGSGAATQPPQTQPDCTPQRAGVGDAAAAHHHRRLPGHRRGERGNARRAERRRVRADLDQRHRAQCRRRRRGDPFEPDLQRVNGSSTAETTPSRRRLSPSSSARFGATYRAASSMASGSVATAPTPRAGQLVGQPGRARCAHLSGRRRQSVSAQLDLAECRAASAAGATRGPVQAAAPPAPRPSASGGPTPSRRDRGADGDAADTMAPRRAALSNSETYPSISSVRLRRRCQQNRARRLCRAAANAR